MSSPSGAVVIGYDGSPDSQRALGWAAAAAQRHARPLHLVVATAGSSGVPPRHHLSWQKAVRIQNEAFALIETYGIADVSRHIIEGGVRRALLEASNDASMVVVGARGRSMLTGAVVGSVSQHVAHHAPCPVVVVRAPADLQSSRVVVGVDGSPGSETALQFALDEASRLGVDVRVVHACRLPSGAVGSMGGYGLLTMRDALEAGERLVAEVLAGWAEKYPDVTIDARSLLLHPVPALTEESRHAALLVLGAHGRGPFRRLLIGSVAQAMLHRSHCPVAIAR